MNDTSDGATYFAWSVALAMAAASVLFECSAIVWMLALLCRRKWYAVGNLPGIVLPPAIVGLVTLFLWLMLVAGQPPGDASSCDPQDECVSGLSAQTK